MKRVKYVIQLCLYLLHNTAKNSNYLRSVSIAGAITSSILLATPAYGNTKKLLCPRP